MSLHSHRLVWNPNGLNFIFPKIFILFTVSKWLYYTFKMSKMCWVFKYFWLDEYLKNCYCHIGTIIEITEKYFLAVTSVQCFLGSFTPLVGVMCQRLCRSAGWSNVLCCFGFFWADRKFPESDDRRLSSCRYLSGLSHSVVLMFEVVPSSSVLPCLCLVLTDGH